MFDETFFFNLKNLIRAEIEEAVVKVSCWDKDTLSKNDLIGDHQFDLLHIYELPNHELYQQVQCSTQSHTVAHITYYAIHYCGVLTLNFRPLLHANLTL